MAEGINNNFDKIKIDRIQSQQSPESNSISENDAVSVFDFDKLSEINPNSNDNQNSLNFVDSENENKPENIKNLNDNLNSVMKKQGVVGKAWNGLKSATGIGSSSAKCEKAIEEYRSGKLSYKEAEEKISDFDKKQGQSLEIATSVASGTVAVGAATLAVAAAPFTAGASIALGVGVAATSGAIVKTGLKTAERATNNIEGDVADAKEMAKDAVKGAVDGTISVATAGTLSAGAAAAEGAVSAGGNAVSQSFGRALLAGAKEGAVTGFKTGLVQGASDYSIEAIFDEDVDFNFDEMLEQSGKTALTGAAMGGVIGGLTKGIMYKSASDTNIQAAEISDMEKLPQNIRNDLADNAQKLNKMYENHLDEAKTQIEQEFGGLKSKEKITARAKSVGSINSKLENKFSKNELNDTAFEACKEAIGDGAGTRLVIKSNSVEKAKEIIEDNLYGYENISYDDFVAFQNNNISSLTKSQIETLEEVSPSVLDILKEEQTQEVVDQLADAVGNGRLKLTELNNYGDELSSYFTDTQLQQISDAYYMSNGKGIKLVSKRDINDAIGKKVDLKSETPYKVDMNTKDAVKKSGYTDAQMNVEHNLGKDGKIMGEFQIRGEEVDKLADNEHIPYDIKKNKIKAGDETYSDIYNVIKGMSEESYDKYNKFLTDTYHSMRLKELGIPSETPKLSDVFTKGEIPDEAYNLLSIEGLSEVAKRKHK